MKMRHLLVGFTFTAGMTFGMSMPASALTAFAITPSSLVLSISASEPECAAAPASVLRSPAPTFAMPAMRSKASAILGGTMSRLEMIKSQQAAGPAPQLAMQSVSELPGAGLVPGAGGVRCASFVQPVQSAPAVALGNLHPISPGRPLGGDDFLASKRVAIKRTSFDGSWNRVKYSSVSSRNLPSALRGTSATGTSSILAKVNSWTNSHVRYVEDQALYGRADYWASANETLKRRAGDCEDIAITKMQILARMGVPRSDMYLTVARDLVRNADHAVLIVRSEGRFVMLDNSTNEILDASVSHDYRPVMSFNNTRKWLHGY